MGNWRKWRGATNSLSLPHNTYGVGAIQYYCRRSNQPMTETSTNELSDYAEYRNAIETMADAVEEKIEEYWEDYSGDVHEMVWEEVDSSQYIIYYGYNLDVLKHAENEPQEWKHRVAEDADYREVLQVMAYSAMERDLYDELQDRGVEV